MIIKFGKQHVSRAKCVKFLDLLLNENLSWNHHLNDLSKKLGRTCGVFFKVRHLLPKKVLISLSSSSSGVRSGADIDDHGTPFFSAIRLSY